MYWLQLRLPSVLLSRWFPPDFIEMERAATDFSFTFLRQQVQRNDIGKLLVAGDAVDPDSHKFHDTWLSGDLKDSAKSGSRPM